MITPSDLGLPDKFSSWRQNQFEIAIKAAGSSKFAFLLDSPTGTGKSIIAAAVQRILSQNIVYLCTTKQLQNQLVNDFPYAKVLKGRANYPCMKFVNMFPEITAEVCNQHNKEDCGSRGRCPYFMAKRAALTAPIAILNMAYFLTEVNYGGTFSGTPYAVLDEMDTVEDQLMNFIELNISKRQLDSLNIVAPKFKTKFESWVEWANETLKVTSHEVDTLAQKMNSDWYTPDPGEVKRLLRLERLDSKLNFFVRNVNENWVWYPGNDAWSFKPIWIAPYAKNALWKHIKKMLGMSATILEPRQASRSIGLMDYEYVALPSLFPKEHRPIYFEPCGDIIEKELSTVLPRLAKSVEKVMQKHSSEKILVHTVSYKVRDYLMKNISSDRFTTHTTFDKVTKLEEFKKSPKPLVMLSPSMDRGVDLPGEECGPIIIAKVPYPNLGDPQVSKRLYASKDGSRWYAYKTVKTIIQMAGRAIRSVDDYGETYILDSQFKRIYTENKDMFPQWFKEAIVM